jgi:peptidyl-prolyl cis-trans isomerase A (cyclophilin A)
MNQRLIQYVSTPSVWVFLAMLLCWPMAADAAKPIVVIDTNVGQIEVELDSAKAPISVQNFLGYVDERHYDNTVFHRVIRGFMVQGGGYTTKYREKKTFAPIKNEATNGLSNERGSIAMARTGVVDSATAQFFINTVNNRRLNHQNKTKRGYGYTVFGRVIRGMEVVDQIERTPTGSCPHFARDCPRSQIVILKVRRKAAEANGSAANQRVSPKGPAKKTQGIAPHPAAGKKN